jgi:hypothetical protein
LNGQYSRRNANIVDPICIMNAKFFIMVALICGVSLSFNLTAVPRLRGRPICHDSAAKLHAAGRRFWRRLINFGLLSPLMVHPMLFRRGEENRASQ